MAHRGPDPDPLDSLEVQAVQLDPPLKQRLEYLSICGMKFPEEAAGKTREAADEGRERRVQRLLPGPAGGGGGGRAAKEAGDRTEAGGSART